MSHRKNPIPTPVSRVIPPKVVIDGERHSVFPASLTLHAAIPSFIFAAPFLEGV